MQDDKKTLVKIEYNRIFRKFPVIPGRDSTPSNSREFPNGNSRWPCYELWIRKRVCYPLHHCAPLSPSNSKTFSITCMYYYACVLCCVVAILPIPFWTWNNTRTRHCCARHMPLVVFWVIMYDIHKKDISYRVHVCVCVCASCRISPSTDRPTA